MQSKAYRSRSLRVDSIVRRPFKKTSAKIGLSPFFVVPGKAKAKQAAPFLFLRRIHGGKKIPIAAAVFGLILAFVFGMWSVLYTRSSVADNQPQVLGAFTDQSSGDQSGPFGFPDSRRRFAGTKQRKRQ